MIFKDLKSGDKFYWNNKKYIRVQDSYYRDTAVSLDSGILQSIPENALVYLEMDYDSLFVNSLNKYYDCGILSDEEIDIVLDKLGKLIKLFDSLPNYYRLVLTELQAINMVIYNWKSIREEDIQRFKT